MAKISKSKNLAAGVTKKIKKAPMVDPKGAYTKIQERTLGNMRKGGKVKKAEDGVTNRKIKSSKDAKAAYEASSSPKINSYAQFPGSTRQIDTVGYAAGKKEFPLKVTRDNGATEYGRVNQSVVKKSLKKSKNGSAVKKTMKIGGVKKAQNGEIETRKKNLFGDVSYSTDTTGFAAGKKMFPMTATNNKTGKVTKSSAPRVIVKRQVKESQVKKNSSGGKTSKKK